jgi:hypothetical protein
VDVGISYWYGQVSILGGSDAGLAAISRTRGFARGREAPAQSDVDDYYYEYCNNENRFPTAGSLVGNVGAATGS